MTETSEPSNDSRDGVGDTGRDLGALATPPSKTPLYQATQAARYQRQALITQIEDATARQLVCYVAGSEAGIVRDDIVGLVDLLHNARPGEPIDLLLHTGGGDIDAAEKLSELLRAAVGEAEFRVVVPDFAKSAGTLLAIGADWIVMSDSSELGPIDPQFVLRDSNGNSLQHPIQSYLDAYEEHRDALNANPSDNAAALMLSKLEPPTVKLFQAIMLRARKLAERQLKQGNFSGGKGNVTLTAGALLDTTRWLSHGQMISWKDAQDPEVGLFLQYLAPNDAVWQSYWQLYCLQRLAVSVDQKLFESRYASLVF